MALVDLVTVEYTDAHRDEAVALRERVESVEGDKIRFCSVRNEENYWGGYAAACNVGASSFGAGTSPVIGFLNPDVQVLGPFADEVTRLLQSPHAAITGNKFGKPTRELRAWGCRDWVCGATFFVKRDWFEKVGGFHEEYVWSWEETDLVRQAQAEKMLVISRELPLRHASPDPETDPHRELKSKMFARGREIFYRRWPR